MYQEQFLRKLKWVLIFLCMILLIGKHLKRNMKFWVYLIGGVMSLIVGYLLFIINQQPTLPPFQDGSILSPSSGYIGRIRHHSNGRVSIMFNLSFMSNHVQYIPYPGEIISDTYHPSIYGRPRRMFTLHPTLFPNFEESIRDNEQYRTILKTYKGNIHITRIAGLVAPRVYSYINEADKVKPGDVMGLILFSSMVLLDLPEMTTLRIKEGDTVTAGETIIGTL